MKIKSLFFTAILICSLGFLACGGGGDDDSDIPSSYVSFTAVNFGGSVVYSSGGNWTGGLSDAEYGGGEPFTKRQPSDHDTYGYGGRVTVAQADWDLDGQDYVLLWPNNNQVGTYSLADSFIRIRLAAIDGGVSFELTGESITITHSDSDYVEGTFTGVYGGNTFSGSFVLTKLADGETLPF
jgi:hypothetical protein